MDKEKLLNLIAQAEANKQDRTAEVIKGFNKNTELHETLTYLVFRGLNAVLKDVAIQERLQQKILVLNPNHYKEIARRIEEREKTPAGIRAKAIRDRKEAQRKEQSEKIETACRASFEKLTSYLSEAEVAMRFYEAWKVGSTPLGECTREQLIKHAKQETKRSAAHEENAAFYNRLAAELKPRQKVKDGIPMDKALKIKENVYNSKTHAVYGLRWAIQSAHKA